MTTSTTGESDHVHTGQQRRDHRPDQLHRPAGLSALRASIIGLTEEQARGATPCRSVLSIGGLIKHATYGMRGALERLDGRGRCGRPRGRRGRGTAQSTFGSFALGDDETGGPGT